MATTTVIGYVDRLGYLRCVPCAVAADLTDGAPIYADNGAHNTEPCDRCGVEASR